MPVLVDSCDKIKTLELWDQALSVIPNGTQTSSKRPDRYVNGVYPKYLEKGDGCMVTDMDGRSYVDYISSLGAVLLGHNNELVTRAVVDAIQNGEVLLSLPHKSEVELAQMLVGNIPGAEKVKFYKTGSEATSAAVKVCRAFTGKEKILACGYHGWHDWFTVSSDKRAGIPKSTRGLIAKFKYNDFESLRHCFEKDNIAAIILEPIVYELPENNFLQNVIEIAHDHNALVVFDEIVTCMRFGIGGAADYLNVTPDITCLGKALGNGYPIAALVGKSAYMSVFNNDDFFVSGTYGGDIIGITAATAVLLALIRNPLIFKNIWKNGELLRNGFNDICREIGFDAVKCVGCAPRTSFSFPTVEHKALFWQECIYGGILFGYANFVTAAHSKRIIRNTLDVCDRALRVVKNAWDNPKAALKGAIPVEVFR